MAATVLRDWFSGVISFGKVSDTYSSLPKVTGIAGNIDTALTDRESMIPWEYSSGHDYFRDSDLLLGGSSVMQYLPDTMLF